MSSPLSPAASGQSVGDPPALKNALTISTALITTSLLHSMRRHPELWGLGMVTLVGAVLRLVHLNSDMWLDEVISLVIYFRLPPQETVLRPSRRTSTCSIQYWRR